ncbi:MAG: sugar phosphate isomerase/epimerase family protein [Planctomycetota bacterium]
MVGQLAGLLGVCSWSLRPTSPADLVERVWACGLRAVQLGLEPIRSGAWDLHETSEALAEAKIDILSGMLETEGEDYSTLESIRATGGLRPDGVWEANRARAERVAEIAEALGMELVTFHAGFIPHDASVPERTTMIDRLRTVADIFADRGVRLALETGQETAETLNDLLDELDRESMGVNFDPANMILYGMGDPIEAFRRLLPRVVQVHLKDATATKTPGEWGTEVALGRGEVDWQAFGGVLASADRPIDALIEREAGEERESDVRHGVGVISSMESFKRYARG